jgi:hypothetical protein
MGTAQFDRQAFLQNKENPPRIPLSVIAPLMLAILVVLGGLLFYKFVILDGGSDASSTRTAELTQIQEKLTRIEQRLDQLEKRRRALSSEASASSTKEQKTATPAAPATAPATRTIYRIFPARSVQNSALAAAIPPSVTNVTDAQGNYQKKEITALQRDVSAGRDEWEATTNRLGNVVGELGAQRNELESNKATLNQLLDRFQREDYTFTLQRRSGRLRVGPLALWLQNSDSRTGRYTMRVMLNDTWIEFKDRAVHEAVDFYPSGSTVPIELVVSQINRDVVAGKIAIPQHLGALQSNQ